MTLKFSPSVLIFFVLVYLYLDWANNKSRKE